jgi:multidrug resistance efflux pump
MIELLLTSFPAVIQYVRLRRRGEPISVANMKTAVFLWLVMAFALFLTIFYYHPKSYTGLVPYRTISVVAQTGGPVTAVHVRNGQHVEAGDFLFEIENSSQKAAVAQAETAFDSIESSEKKARERVEVAKAGVAQAEAQVAQLSVDLANAEELQRKNVGTADTVRKLQSSLTVAQAALDAAKAQQTLAATELSDVLPAARKSAEAALEAAKVELAKTQVRSFAPGTVTQLALSEGSPATRFVASPAMVIIPDRPQDIPVRVVAGFPQVAYDVLHVGMPAEIACDSNMNLAMDNVYLPVRIAMIQPAIAAGQVTPGASLIELDTRIQRGSVTVFFELENQEQEPFLLDGSGCLVQTYTNNLHGPVGHVIAATGIVKAFLLRTLGWGLLTSGVGLVGGH